MTEAEWLACQDPEPMQKFLRGRISNRKWRLFVAACSRRIWDLLREGDRRAVELVEQNAERLSDADGSDPSDLRTLLGIVDPEDFVYVSPHAAGFTPVGWAAVILSAEAISARQCEPEVCSAEIRAQADLMREIVGNPFRPATLAPTLLAWNDGAVPKLARVIYDEKSFEHLPLVADALEEAGCTDAELLAHCRQEGGHIRGCWAVDSLLGKE
jgi:hypothetical protein